MNKATKGRLLTKDLRVNGNPVANGAQVANIADAVALTENGFAIGGTNDGDLPNLTTPNATVNAAAIRECAVAINTLTTKLNSVIAALEEFGIVAGS